MFAYVRLLWLTLNEGISETYIVTVGVCSGSEMLQNCGMLLLNTLILGQLQLTVERCKYINL